MTVARPGERLRDYIRQPGTQLKTNPEHIRVGGPRLHQRRLPRDQLLRLIHKDIDGNPELDINKARHKETTGPSAETGSTSYFEAFKEASAWLPDPVKFLKTASDWLTTFLPHAPADRQDPAEKAARSVPSIPGAKREAAVDFNPLKPYAWSWLGKSVNPGLKAGSENWMYEQTFLDPTHVIKTVWELEEILKRLDHPEPITCGSSRLELDFDQDVFSYPVLVDNRLLPLAFHSFYAIHGRFHGITGYRNPVPVMVMPPLSCDPNRPASTASFNPASCEIFKEGDLVPQIDKFFAVDRTGENVTGMVFVDPNTIIRWVKESAFLKPGQGQIALAIVFYDDVYSRRTAPPVPKIDNKVPNSEINVEDITSKILGFTGLGCFLALYAAALNPGAAKSCIRKISSAICRR